METNKCVSCIKNGSTGECYDIKDKVAREGLEQLQETVNNLTGVDGGHLATDQDISNLQTQIDNIPVVDTSNLATDEDIANLQTQIDNLPTGGDTTELENTVNTISNHTLNFQIYGKDCLKQYTDGTGKFYVSGGINTYSVKLFKDHNGKMQTTSYQPNNATPVDFFFMRKLVDEAINPTITNVNTITTTLNEVIETVNNMNISSGGMSLKSQVVTGTYSEIRQTLFDMILTGKFAYANFKVTTATSYELNKIVCASTGNTVSTETCDILYYNENVMFYLVGYESGSNFQLRGHHNDTGFDITISFAGAYPLVKIYKSSVDSSGMTTYCKDTSINDFMSKFQVTMYYFE